MSLNTAHLNGGVLIHSGECILLFCENVTIEWSGQNEPAFNGSKHGRIYLTTHRMIFNNKAGSDPMQSFSFPFITLSEVGVEQPIFGANYIKGKVRAQPNGNWIGEAKFKVTFKTGGAIDFGEAMLKAAQLATRNAQRDAPPPYVPPQTQWYAAPPPAYAPPPQGYYGWSPPTNVFPQQPPTGAVFMTDAPPPYPGINVPGQAPHPQGAQGFGYPPQPQGFGFSQPGYGPPGAAGFAPGASGGMQQPGFSSADAKAAEAAQSAYYDPNQPQMAYVPPPAYYENPPSYNNATNNNNKKEQ